MFAFLSPGTELSRFKRGTLPKIAVAVMLFIPLIYGALYLWAFQAPDKHMDSLPVALVNQDAGATKDGERLTAGNDLVDKLTEGMDLKWQVTDADAAAKGVDDGTYYFALTIPENFSASAISVGTGNPEQTVLDVDFNDANNFLSSVLGKQAMAQVRDAVAAQLGQQTSNALLVGLHDAGEGLRTAAGGAGEIAAGVDSAKDGAGKLVVGMDSLADGTLTLKDGAAQLAAGASSLSTGLNTLSTGAGTLANGTSTLSTGAGELAGRLNAAVPGAATLKDGAASLAANTGSLSSNAATLAKSATGLAAGANGVSADAATTSASVSSLLAAAQALPPSPEATALVADLQALQSNTVAPMAAKAAGVAGGADKLAAGATPLANGAAQLSAGAAQLSGGVGTLVDGVGQAAAGSSALAAGASQVNDGAAALASGAATANNGAATLASGAGTLSAGTGTLADGAGELVAGGTQLSEGADKLSAGSHTLADKLAEGGDKIPNDSADLIRAKSDIMGAPVAVDAQWANQSNSFGEGFAPFFIALATFVGALISWLLLRALPTRALAAGAGGLRTVLTALLPALAIGLGQVAIMVAVLLFGLDMKPVHPVGMAAFIYLTTVTFLALQQMFIIVLGTAAGRVASLVLLMLQLSSSGGTYPVETTPEFFQALHPFMPATYVVDGLRELMTGGVDARLWISVVFLAVLAIASVAVSAFSASRQRVFSIKRLHPELVI
ncbi:YhgE/Pip domain-containing protein [Arthrobacter sp. 35W]|uniref:YhgE/Pip domain-containing protein n=1 Tax=Arthrobacter sp. 35W TaxID=1132441 RepID=UPI00040A6D31|nr:YhgE/Pip domain-containing protein [Arthrobacter sp. 35W]